MRFLTWLFDNKEDGFATGIFIILKTLHAIILIFVSAIHRICVMELCVKNVDVTLQVRQYDPFNGLFHLVHLWNYY